jgi:tetratricopeptide (TPR) repeat protein
VIPVSLRILAMPDDPQNRVKIPLPILVAIGLFGILLASFPARNLDIWTHLVAGRDLLTGQISTTWLFDFFSATVFRLSGGVGLIGIKALALGALGGILLRRSSTHGWKLAFAVTGLALLAVASRYLLQPQFVSVALLTVAVGLSMHRDLSSSWWPGTAMVVLLMAWANIDSWFVIGLVTVALIQAGRWWDDRAKLPSGSFRHVAIGLAVLVAASCLSVNHVHGLRLPAELQSAIASLRNPEAGVTIHSPFDPDFVRLFRDQSTSLAYFPLLVLSAISFPLNRPGFLWSRFLPWILLAVVSGIEARAIPFFAVVAGPITAWNFQEFFSRRTIRPAGRWASAAGSAVGGLIVVAFLIAAWPGWLQGPPYEPRRWAVECPSAIRDGAAWLNEQHASRKGFSDGTTMHASSDVRDAIGWWCPADRGIRDDVLTGQLLSADRQVDARQRFRDLRVRRAIIWAGDPFPSAKALLDRLMADGEEWRLVRLSGGLAVFERRDPNAPTAETGVSVDRLAFLPGESERVPPNGPRPPRPWWTAFVTPAEEARAPSRDEAAVLLRRAESSRSTSAYRHMSAWESMQVAGLVGASNQIGFGVETLTRLTFFRPPLPERGGQSLPPQTELAFAYQRSFAADRGLLPLAEVMAAVRAGRRAVAENPDDANAYYTLGQAYSTLANLTAENRWSSREGVSQIRRIRHVQASAAFNRALQLNPRLAGAHRDLALLYRSIGCLDLAVDHLKAYVAIPPRWGGPPKTGPEAEEMGKDLKQLAKFVDDRLVSFERNSAKSSVSDRALLATQMELGGVARSILLKSDVSAFGQSGVELEVDLLLRTGRPREVLDWTTPEVRGSLGDQKYHWTRAQAHLALGDYAAADVELADMIGPGGRMAAATSVGLEMAPVVGKNILDGVPKGGVLADSTWFMISRLDLERRAIELAQTLTLQANMVTLRGVIAFEAGSTDASRAHLTQALSLTPTRYGSGQLDFNGRRVAWDLLSLLDSFNRPGLNR